MISCEWSAEHIGALDSNGNMWMWGSGVIGNGKYGSEGGSSVPVKILSDVAEIAVSSNCYALKKDGSLWAWGSSRYGEALSIWISSFIPSLDDN